MLISGATDFPSAAFFGSPAAWLMSVFSSFEMSYTNTSEVPGASDWPGERSVASLAYAIQPPSRLRMGATLAPSPVSLGAPSLWLARTASPPLPVWKTSSLPLLSF